MRPLYLGLLIPLVALACADHGMTGGGDNDEPKCGYLEYRKDFSGGRLMVIDGAHITANVQVSYDAPPAGAHDGDSGEDLFLRFTDESLLKDGAVIPLSDPGMDVHMAKWASPAGYDIFNDSLIDGTITIHKFLEYDSLLIHADLVYGNEWFTDSLDQDFCFRMSTPWVAPLDPNIPWEVVDSASLTPTAASMEGNWESCKQYTKSGDYLKELIHCKEARQLFIKAGQYQTGGKTPWQDFTIDGTRWYGPTDSAIINNLTADSLVLTHWITNGYFRMEYVRVK